MKRRVSEGEYGCPPNNPYEGYECITKNPYDDFVYDPAEFGGPVDYAMINDAINGDDVDYQMVYDAMCPEANRNIPDYVEEITEGVIRSRSVKKVFQKENTLVVKTSLRKFKVTESRNGEIRIREM